MVSFAILVSALISVASALSTSPNFVKLGRATPFAVLSGAGVTNSGPSTINGSLGTTSPNILGFPPGIIIGTKEQNTSPANNGYADYQLAYTYGNSLGATIDKAGTTSLNGVNYIPGVYKHDNFVALDSTMTFTGGPNDVWVIKCASTLTVNVGGTMILAGGARPENIFWMVKSSATIKTNAVFKGNVIAYAQVAVQTGADIQGGLYAGTLVTLQSNTVTGPLVLNPLTPTTLTRRSARDFRL